MSPGEMDEYEPSKLVSAVAVMRLRTRVLVWGGVAMLVWLVVLTWWG